MSEMEKVLGSFLENARGYSVILIDSNLKIQNWLADSENIFGYTEDEIRGSDFSSLFTPEDREKGIPSWERTAALEHGIAENDRWMMRKNGLRFWATGTLSPMRSPSGELQGYLKLLRDRTELKGLLEKLEKQVDYEKRAAVGKDMAMSTVAHEIRNPLNSLAAAVKFLERTQISGEQTQFALSTIRNQVDFMAKLVTRMLDASRLQAGKNALEKKIIVLNDVLRAAVASCGAAIEQKGQTLKTIILEAPVHVDGDDISLQQVFINLLENAVKFTPPEGTISVLMHVEGREVIASIIDDGIGIAAEMLPRIFDLFVQASPASTSGGLGIGLSLVKNIIELHGGVVSVKSPGVSKGSRFEVRLPVAGQETMRPDSPV